jgi:hypothetical protein
MQGTKNQPLSKTHKDLASQWNYELNKGLTPDHVTCNSNDSVWWQCAAFKSHVWATEVSKRTTANEKGCPFCWGRKQDKKTFLQVNPRAAEQWHPTKNKSLTAGDVLPNSSAVVWWQCLKDESHVWQAEVTKVNRSVREDFDGLGCPQCKKPSKWGNSMLAESHPKLLDEWHKTKNGNLSPSEVSPGSAKVVWWKCPKNRKHAYRMAVCHRVYLNSGCPYCSNMRVLPDVNSLAATNPELAKQWHETLNGDVKATEVVAGSAAKAWWQCEVEKSHVWEAQIFSRGVQLKGCPFCTGRKVDKTNSLAALKPELAKEWHPSLNLELTPEDITTGSDRRVWWYCRNDASHSWQAQVYKRSEGRGLCPQCNPRSRPKKRNISNP